MQKILFDFGSIKFEAELLSTPTAEAILGALPIKGRVMTWGEEVYFHTPVAAEREMNARSVVQAGEIAYWPDGNAIAIGFGRTPISAAGEIRLASPCNIWAKALSDVRVLKIVGDGNPVSVSAIE